MNRDSYFLQKLQKGGVVALEELEVVPPADGSTADDDVGERGVTRFAGEEALEVCSIRCEFDSDPVQSHERGDVTHVAGRPRRRGVQGTGGTFAAGPLLAERICSRCED